MPINRQTIPIILFELGLVLIIVGIPFAKTLIHSGTYLSILTWLLWKIKHRQGGPSFSAFKPWLLFLGFCFISIWVSEFTSISLRAFFTKYFKYFLLVVAMQEFLTSEIQLKRLLWIAGFVLSIVLLNGWLQYQWGIDITGHKAQRVYIIHQDIRRINGSFAHPNDYGTYLITLIPILMGLICYCKRIGIKLFDVRLWLPSLLFIGTLLSLYLTQSRGATAALLASSGCYIFILKKKWGIVFIIAVLIFLFLPIPFSQNMRNTFNLKSASSGSFRDRKYLWETTAKMIKARPLLGWGLNTYARVHPRFVGNLDSWYPHNCYLQMASEIGLLGLLSFLILIGTLLFSLYKKISHPLAAGLWVSLLAQIFHAGVDTNFYSPSLMTLFWFIVGMGLIVPVLVHRT